jgi:hypothetical protein
MEAAHLSSYINGMQKTFTRNTPKTNPEGRIHPSGTTSNTLKSEFSQSVEKKVLVVRSKICEAMERASKVTDSEYLTNI